MVRKEVQNRVCKVCKCGNTGDSKWVFGYFVPDNLRCVVDDINIGVKDWVCEKCNQLIKNITSATQNKPQTIRDAVVTIAKEKLKWYGVCFMSELICEFKELTDIDDEYEIERESLLLRKHIKASLRSKRYQWFTPNKKGGSMF